MRRRRASRNSVSFIPGLFLPRRCPVQWIERTTLPEAALSHSTAEEKLAHPRIGQHRSRRGLHPGTAELQHDAEIRDLERALGVLLDHQDRDALCAQVLEDAEGFLHE